MAVDWYMGVSMRLIVLALVTSGWTVCASKTLLGIIEFILKLNLTLLVIYLLRSILMF